MVGVCVGCAGASVCVCVCRTGDLALLQVDAVVNPTNETLTDKNAVSQRLHQGAGPELRDECKTQVGCE